MSKGRLEAFTDGVLAIIITIMVLELKVPHEADLAGVQASLPLLCAYLLSFINVGIFWVNHHHMLHVTDQIDGRVLWANLALLFWLSLVPFVIRWMDEAGFTAWPTAAYGFVLMMAAVSYTVLQWTIVKRNGRSSRLAEAVGHDLKGKASFVMYALSIPLAFVHPWIAIGLYIAVALMWLVPDRRIEKHLKD
jgi:uncharacterized membrane protein